MDHLRVGPDFAFGPIDDIVSLFSIHSGFCDSPLLGGLADPRIEGIGRVERLVERPKCGLRFVEVADIVLGRIFGTAPIQQSQKFLDRKSVV